MEDFHSGCSAIGWPNVFPEEWFDENIVVLHKVTLQSLTI